MKNINLKGYEVNGTIAKQKDRGNSKTNPFDSKNIEITYNNIHNNNYGLALYDGWPSLINVNYNQIVDNTAMGAYNYLAEDANFEKNYWGHPTGADHSSNPHGTGAGGDIAKLFQILVLVFFIFFRVSLMVWL